MKKLLLSLCIGLTVSGYINASVINVDGWDSYEPPIRVANDTEIDDDATGKSTANGVVITKPNADNINKNIDVVDCDNPRFSEICQQLNVTITNEVNEASKDAKSYAKYLSDRDREEMNRLVADTRDFADKRADQAQNNAEDHADWIRGDLKTYADFVAEQAKDNANQYSNNINNTLQNYVDAHNKESKQYAEYLANKAKNDANQYTDDRFNDLSSSDIKRQWHYQGFSNGHTFANNYGHEIIINVRGGNKMHPNNPNHNQNNRCQLTIAVNGSTVASAVNNNDQWGKECFVTATVPHGANYQITSNPWNTVGSPSVHTSVFR